MPSPYPPLEEEMTPATPSIPHSREAEEAAIGAVMINPPIYFDLVQFLEPDDFYIHRHRWIWESFGKLQGSRTPIDFLTLSEQLDRDGRLAELGGPAYITSLINQVPTSLNAVSYGRIIEAHSIRRKMIAAANEIASLAYREEIPVEEATSKAAMALHVPVSMVRRDRMLTAREVVRLTMDRVDERSKSKSMPGIPTGLIDLDRKLGGGAQAGELLLVATRPGCGKTSLLLQIAKHAAYKYKKHVAVFSMEMSHEEVMLRLFNQEDKALDNQVVRAGKLPDGDWPILTSAAEMFEDLTLYIDDTPMLTPTQIRARCEVLANKGMLDEIIVDYLGLMRVENPGRMSRVDETNYIAEELKGIAKTFDVPLWAAHQMNRDIERRGEDARPQLADLRDGGEQPANVVMFIHHDRREDDSVKASELIVAKHRNGPTGTIPVVWIPEKGGKFESAYSSTNYG